MDNGNIPASVPELVARISTVLLNPLVALIFAGSFLVFIWGLVMYLYELNAGGKMGGDGKKHMFWGIIGMFIMVAAWTIVKIIDATLGSNYVH